MSSTSIANTGLLHPTEILRAPNYVNTAVLAAATGEAFDVPAGAQYVSFGANVDFFVKWGSTAASVPSTDYTDGSGSELNPTVRNIGSTNATTGLSLIAVTTGIVTMSWYV